jgi:hypothetical protein
VPDRTEPAQPVTGVPGRQSSPWTAAADYAVQAT